MEGLAAVISAVGAIVTAVMGMWMKYNQTAKDKMLDMKIEHWKKSEEEKNLRRSHFSAVVYGELWNILHELQADRVYIVQPHPLGGKSLYLSVYYEVKRKGVDEMKDNIHQLKISEVAKFTSELATNGFMFFDDIENQVKDKYARSMMSRGGCAGVIIKRLEGTSEDWVGSIFCEFVRPMATTEAEARDVMQRVATIIQYNLPEIKI